MPNKLTEAQEWESLTCSKTAVRQIALATRHYTEEDRELTLMRTCAMFEDLDLLGEEVTTEIMLEIWRDFGTPLPRWQVVDEDGNTYNHLPLSLSAAESLLCRCCNEEVDAYLEEIQ